MRRGRIPCDRGRRSRFDHSLFCVSVRGQKIVDVFFQRIELIVPVASTALPHPLRYTTRVGDTLVTIADRFNVSVEDLRRWNHLSSSSIAPRRSLFVAQPVRLAPATHVRAKGSHSATGAKTKSSAPSAKSTSHAATLKKTSRSKQAK